VLSRSLENEVLEVKEELGRRADENGRLSDEVSSLESATAGVSEQIERQLPWKAT
jgi:hypothetical protein